MQVRAREHRTTEGEDRVTWDEAEDMLDQGGHVHLMTWWKGLYLRADGTRYLLGGPTSKSPECEMPAWLRKSVREFEWWPGDSSGPCADPRSGTDPRRQEK